MYSEIWISSKLKLKIDWLITWFCMSTCLGNHFLQCTIFLMLKWWGFGSQRSVDIPWMLKGSLVVSYSMPNKPCLVVLFSLSTLWLHCFWLFIGFLTCYCYMWTWNKIIKPLFSQSSLVWRPLPSKLLDMFSSPFKNNIKLSVYRRHDVAVGKVFNDYCSIPS
jgi:hypothetical protein